MKRFKIVTLITLMTLSSTSLLYAAVATTKCARSDIKVVPYKQGDVKVNYLQCLCQDKEIYLQVTGIIREKDYTNLMNTCPKGEETLADDHFITPEYSVFVDKNGGGIDSADHSSFQQAKLLGLKDIEIEERNVDLTNSQQRRQNRHLNRAERNSDKTVEYTKEFVQANKDAIAAGKAPPYEYNDETERWEVSDQIRGKGTTGKSIGGWKSSEINKFERRVGKYNTAADEIDESMDEANGIQNNANSADLKKRTASYNEALEEAQGDYNAAYANRRNDLIYKFEQACVKHQTIKKEASGEMGKSLISFGYPESDADLNKAVERYSADAKKAGRENDTIADDALVIYTPSTEDENAKEFTGSGCEAWATFQSTNGEELVAARKNVIEEDNALQMSYDANGTPSEENPQIQKDVEEQLAEAFEYSHCSTRVFSKTLVNNSFEYTKTEVAPGEVIDYSTAYLNSASGHNPAFSDPEFRRVPKPASCINEEKNYITNQDYSYYTDYSETTAALLTEKGKKRVCEGALFQRGEDGVACNDLFKAAQSCNDENSPFISESPATTVKFEDHKFAQIINTYLQSVNANPTNPDSNQTANTLTFGEKEHCQKFMINKFKQCIGTAYSKIDIAYTEADPTTGKAAEAVVTPTEARADEESVAIAKTKLAKEMGLQFGTCIAFRKLSQEIANDLGESWAQPGQTHASADGRVLCQRIAPWTLDYKACKNLADTQSGFMVGDMARNVGGQGWSMVRQNQIRNESQDQMASANQNGTLQPGDEGYVSPQDNQVNVALDSQKKMYEHQKNKETMNLGFHAAQAGTLTTLLSTYPTPNKIGRQSEDHPYLSTIIDVSERFSGVKSQLFANQEQRKKMWGQVMESAASATLAALKAAQYKKMANDVQTYKNAFNDLNKDATSSSSTLEVGYCSLNPTAPGCTNTGPRVMGNSQFSYGSIGAQNASGGAIDFNSDQGNLGAFDEEELTASQQSAIDDLGNIIDQDSAGSFGNDFKKVGAGNFSRSPASGGGGGGGGGGAGGGGSAYNGGGAGGGAGGNNSAFGGPKQKVSFGAAGGKVKYSGSGSGSSKKSSNPFSSLFGKKKGRNVASKVTNDIAPSHSGLFDKISKRYTKMQQADRLHKLK